MEYSKEELIEFKEKGTSTFLKIMVILTIVFSIINCICIYDFYRLLCRL